MKQLLFAAALFVASHTMAQTTQEEYNYVTRGYIDVLRRGLDVKSDYRVEPVFTGNQEKDFFSKYQFKFSHLINKSTNKVKATIVEYYFNGGLLKILCLPLPYSSPYIMTDYFNSIQKLGAFESSIFARDVSLMYMNNYSYTVADSTKRY